MPETVISVESLGKLYKLGEIGTGTLSHDLNRWWARLRGKEDPMAIVGQVNDRTSSGTKDWVWALKDINFDIKQGEVIGIIGRNGAGKSTLLKILSKVTSPTTGRIKLKGRIASLLEVGTGFHQELTGRENIFLNGAILGMRKAEIRSKFDQIVDFAGVEKYIDTPVKRYSSGMYVRLAFAVAAFLEPEILIIDEVLAVGDAEFQEKCLGRMKDVSQDEGRTIIFVSHNMASISKLCTRGILLKNGQVLADSKISEVVEAYASSNHNTPFYINEKPLGTVYIDQVDLRKSKAGNERENVFFHNDGISMNIKLANANAVNKYTVGVAMLDINREKLFTSHFEISNPDLKSLNVVCCIPPDILNQGRYSFDIAVFQKGSLVYEYLKDVCPFNITDAGSELYYQAGENIGPFRVNCQWSINA